MRLDDLHRLLETADRVVAKLAKDKRESIDISDYYQLCEIILEVLGWTSTAYTDNPFGVSPTVLNKFVKMRGTIRTHTARGVADRVRSYLRSQDQRTERAPTDRDQIPTLEKAPTISPMVTFPASRWVAVPGTSEVQAKISAVATLLEGLIEQASRSNLPPGEQALSDLQKQQLIAILETALNVLRSPLVERSLLDRAGKILERGAETAAEKGVQKGLGRLMEIGVTRLSELISLIFL